MLSRASRSILPDGLFRFRFSVFSHHWHHLPSSAVDSKTQCIWDSDSPFKQHHPFFSVFNNEIPQKEHWRSLVHSTGFLQEGKEQFILKKLIKNKWFSATCTSGHERGEWKTVALSIACKRSLKKDCCSTFMLESRQSHNPFPTISYMLSTTWRSSIHPFRGRRCRSWKIICF